MKLHRFSGKICWNYSILKTGLPSSGKYMIIKVADWSLKVRLRSAC